jgi:dCTP deaminase
MSTDISLHERLVVTPLLEASQIGEASIDLRLGTEFLILRRTRYAGVDPASRTVDIQAREIVDRHVVPLGRPLWLHPDQFVLGATLEFVRLPSYVGAYVLGRSSWGRIGLIVATAVMIQPGFTGAITLELVNEGESPIALYPGSRIAQLAVHELDASTEHGYDVGDPKYFAPIGPQVSQLSREAGEIGSVRRTGLSLERQGDPEEEAGA